MFRRLVFALAIALVATAAGPLPTGALADDHDDGDVELSVGTSFGWGVDVRYGRFSPLQAAETDIGGHLVVTRSRFLDRTWVVVSLDGLAPGKWRKIKA